MPSSLLENCLLREEEVEEKLAEEMGEHLTKDTSGILFELELDSDYEEDEE